MRRGEGGGCRWRCVTGKRFMTSNFHAVMQSAAHWLTQGREACNSDVPAEIFAQSDSPVGQIRPSIAHTEVYTDLYSRVPSSFFVSDILRTACTNKTFSE